MTASPIEREKFICAALLGSLVSTVQIPIRTVPSKWVKSKVEERRNTTERCSGVEFEFGWLIGRWSQSDEWQSLATSLFESVCLWCSYSCGSRRWLRSLCSWVSPLIYARRAQYQYEFESIAKRREGGGLTSICINSRSLVLFSLIVSIWTFTSTFYWLNHLPRSRSRSLWTKDQFGYLLCTIRFLLTKTKSIRFCSLCCVVQVYPLAKIDARTKTRADSLTNRSICLSLCAQEKDTCAKREMESLRETGRQAEREWPAV